MLLFVLPVSLFIVLTCSARPFAICDPYVHGTNALLNSFFIMQMKIQDNRKLSCSLPRYPQMVFLVCAVVGTEQTEIIVLVRPEFTIPLCVTQCFVCFLLLSNSERLFCQRCFRPSTVAYCSDSFLYEMRYIHVQSSQQHEERRTREYFGRQ